MKMKDSVRLSVEQGNSVLASSLCLRLNKMGLNYEGIIEFFQAHSEPENAFKVRAFLDEALGEHLDKNRR